MSRGRALIAVWISSFGCSAPPSAASAPPPPVPAPLASSAPSANPLPSASVEAPARLPIVFEAGPLTSVPADVAPHVEIQFPILGKQVSAEKAKHYEIRLKAERWSKDLRCALVLDDFPPRVIDDPSRPIQLGELVPANREFEPGAHRLFAAAVGPNGLGVKPSAPGSLAPFAYVPFWIGDTQSSTAAPFEAEGPMLVMLAPWGTFNGNKAADDVLIDFYALGARVGSGAFRVKAEVVAMGQSYETSLTSLAPQRIRGLPSGDHVVRLALIGPDGQPAHEPFATVQRTITVNRDAPVE